MILDRTLWCSVLRQKHLITKALGPEPTDKYTTAEHISSRTISFRLPTERTS